MSRAATRSLMQAPIRQHRAKTSRTHFHPSLARSSHFTIRMSSSETIGTHEKFREVMAPAAYEKTGLTVFLSGSIDTPPATWQKTVTAALSHMDVTLLNPHREDWDETWREDASFKPWAEQVKWELDGMEAADIMAVYFGPKTPAPITLMELGLWARGGKCVVGVSENYPKKGNVKAVCERYKIECVGTVGELIDGVKRKMDGLREKAG